MAKEGVNVLINHPRLVQTGLELIEFRQSFGLRPSSLFFNGSYIRNYTSFSTRQCGTLHPHPS